jgi:molybdate transport system substrate-binding protein
MIRRKTDPPVPILTMLLAVIGLAARITDVHADELRVVAAGSLREVVGAIGDHYRETTGVEVKADFGPSGILREWIEKGEQVDLFASAEMGHPLKLLAEGRATRVDMFTRNALCAFALPKAGLTPANFLDRLLDREVKLGTSTPRADPAGDYTWLMFHRAETINPGAYATLDQKAQKIVGGPTNNAPVNGKDPAVAALSDGRIDVMIGYCSGRKRMLSALPGLASVEVPKEIAASPEYGLAILRGPNRWAEDLALYMLSPEGQRLFGQFGFAPVGLPTPEP